MVDVITCVRNGEKYLSNCIESVLNQTYTDLTYYIVDNCSTDSTKKIIEDFQKKDQRIIYLYQSEIGHASSLNFALNASKNDFICFLDSDDLFHPQKIEKQLEFFEQNTQYEICFTKIREFLDKEDLNLSHQPRKEVLDGLSKCSMMIKKSLLNKTGLFNTTVEIDFVEWFSRIIRKKISYTILPELLCFRRIHNNNMTKNIKKSKYLEVIKMHLDASVKQK
jgi:glycosyltransferase involved in cell wall biosynthesis